MSLMPLRSEFGGNAHYGQADPTVGAISERLKDKMDLQD
jgi:hypothetical protein